MCFYDPHLIKQEQKLKWILQGHRASKWQSFAVAHSLYFPTLIYNFIHYYDFNLENLWKLACQYVLQAYEKGGFLVF